MILNATNLHWLSESIAWVLIILVLLFTLILALRSNLLRDDVDDIATFAANAKKDKRYASKVATMTDQDIADQIPHPYSLSKTQLAIWTALIGCVYIYLALYCHTDLKAIVVNATALTLLGISAGTTTAAGVIDQSQANTPATPPRHQNAPSEGFIKDILSDQNGVSIHRFQNVVWTVIAVAIYLYKVHQDQSSLPNLDNTLIILTGISSAAYLSLKINENK